MKWLLPLMLVVSGCVHVSKDVLVDRSAQPVPQEHVRVYLFGEELPEACEQVAYLHASASEDFSDRDEVVEKFRKEAGKLGANAVSVRAAFANSRRGSSFLSSPSAREFDADAYWCAGAAGA